MKPGLQGHTRPEAGYTALASQSELLTIGGGRINAKPRSAAN